ncbi:MAG: 50S ribosomal protein L35 [Alphaproteobacteria bacterium]|nr:50S ribosomal protein L35 [Alphaproteobacteria bacterium]
MPKLKTKSSVKKRFKVTKSGKVKAGSAFTSHMMQNKGKSMKRKARRTSALSAPDARIVLRNWFPYSRKKASKSKIKTEGAK